MSSAFEEDRSVNNSSAQDSSMVCDDDTSTGMLDQQIAIHLASNNEVILKSQQRGEPDLTYEQRQQLASSMLHTSPSNFLYRFGKYLKIDHLSYFQDLATSDSLVEHYLKETRNILNPRKAKIKIRNRRWAAAHAFELAAQTNATDSSQCEEGSSSSGQTSNFVKEHKEYFSETEMRRRCPALYDEYVGKHLTEEERRQRKADFDRADCKLSTIMFDHMDQCEEKELKKKQEDADDDMFEEEEDSEEDEAMEEEQSSDQQNDECNPAFKSLLRQEFITSLKSSFIAGNDSTFDYKSVDNNEDFTLLEIENHDEEERYFDEEEPRPAESPALSTHDSPVLPPRRAVNKSISNNLQEDSISVPSVENLSIK